MTDSASSMNKIKRDILKNENKKLNNYGHDFDEDDDDYNNRKVTKKNDRSNSESSQSTIGNKDNKNTRKKSVSRSRSSSRSTRTRSNYSDNDRYSKDKKSRDRRRSYTPSASTTNSRNTLPNKKSYSTQEKRNDTTYKTSKVTSKSSQRSAQSLPGPNDRNSFISRKKDAYKTKLKPKTKNSVTTIDQVNNKASRLISAQRIKNNDLQNRISEMNIELEKLREENKTLKRVQRREEQALKKIETQDTDINRIVKGYQDEINSLKQTIKKMQNENRRINNNLMEREDELRILKKKYNELKDILNDKKLIESAELTKKLEAREQELNEEKTKSQNLERRLEIIEKNHKHEIGVEIARHKETQKQLQAKNGEFTELKVKLEEKERALDALNIYSRQNRENNPPPVPQWKMSSSSLNASLAVQDTPVDKRKEYDRKVKEKLQKNKNKEEDKTKIDSERNNEKPKLDSDRTDHAKPPNQTHNQSFLAKLTNDENDEYDDRKRKMELERKRLEEEEAELRRKDEAERMKREQKEREDRERIERLRKEAAETEKKRKQEKEEEERKLKEKALLEDLERKKRWVNTDFEENNSEKQKDDLLAKLFSSDKNNDADTVVTPVPQPIIKKNIFDIKPTTTNATTTSTNNNTNSNFSTKATVGDKNTNSDTFYTNGFNNTANSYKFPRTVENLHEGKPTNSSRNDDDDLFSTNKNTKTDLLDKLFGNNDKPSSSNFLQNKLDSLEDFPDNATKNTTNTKSKPPLQTNQSFKSTQNTSKAQFLPFELPEAQTGTPSSNKRQQNDTTTTFKTTTNKSAFDYNDDVNFFSTPATTTTNSMKRPKEINNLFTSNKLNTHNSNNFVEDIEELVL